MTDGQADLPEDQLTEFTEADYFGNIKFTCVAFGSDANENILKSMATQMNGSFQKADDGIQLSQGMMKMVMELNSLRE